MEQWQMFVVNWQFAEQEIHSCTAQVFIGWYFASSMNKFINKSG